MRVVLRGKVEKGCGRERRENESSLDVAWLIFLIIMNKKKKKTKYIVVKENESLKIKFCNGYHWQTKTFTNEELDDIFYHERKKYEKWLEEQQFTG